MARASTSNSAAGLTLIVMRTSDSGRAASPLAALAGNWAGLHLTRPGTAWCSGKSALSRGFWHLSCWQPAGATAPPGLCRSDRTRGSDHRTAVDHGADGASAGRSVVIAWPRTRSRRPAGKQRIGHAREFCGELARGGAGAPACGRTVLRIHSELTDPTEKMAGWMV
jgi:hypothetical protein